MIKLYIRAALVSSNISYRQGLPPVFDSLGLKQPTNLTGIISKVNRYVAKAEKTGDYLPLCQETTELLKTRTELIGPACSKIGITPQWLQNADICSAVVTNHVIIELQQFRAKKGIAWKTVHGGRNYFLRLQFLLSAQYKVIGKVWLKRKGKCLAT